MKKEVARRQDIASPILFPLFIHECEPRIDACILCREDGVSFALAWWAANGDNEHCMDNWVQLISIANSHPSTQASLPELAPRQASSGANLAIAGLSVPYPTDVYVRFFLLCSYPSRDQSQLTGLALADSASRASMRAHRRICAGLVTRSTFDHEAVNKLEKLRHQRSFWLRIRWARESTTSALGEKSEEDVFDASSEDELLGEQLLGEHNQWCQLLEICFQNTVGRVLVKALGVDSAMRVSKTSMLAILTAASLRTSACGDQTTKWKNKSSHDANMFQGPALTHSAACRSPTRLRGARSCALLLETMCCCLFGTVFSLHRSFFVQVTCHVSA